MSYDSWKTTDVERRALRGLLSGDCPECGEEHPAPVCRCLRGDPDCDHATMNCAPPVSAGRSPVSDDPDDLPFE